MIEKSFDLLLLSVYLCRAEWNCRIFKVVDTGGLIFDEDQDNLFAPQIREQALLALDEAVASILVVDGQVGR